jgi:hypothetical protein
MDAFEQLMIILGALLVFDGLAIRFGADSRKVVQSDWIRPLSS